MKITVKDLVLALADCNPDLEVEFFDVVTDSLKVPLGVQINQYRSFDDEKDARLLSFRYLNRSTALRIYIE